MSKIPYLFLRVMPRYRHDYCDMVHYTEVTAKENMDKDFINLIVSEMMQYSEENPFTSYNDFCMYFWELQDYLISNEPIMQIHYFENEWVEWNISKFEDKIMEKYKLKHKEHFCKNT
jgi:hypothetical protein